MRTAVPLLVALFVGCSREVPSVTASPVTPSSSTPAPVPAPSPAAAPGRIALAQLPPWTSAPQTLLTHPGPIWDLQQTRTHVGWAEPAEARSGRFNAIITAVAKAKPAASEVLVSVPVDSRYSTETALVSSASRFFLFAPGPGDVTYAAATVVDPSTRAKRTQTLPAKISVWNGLPLAAAVDDTLVVASDVVDGSSTISVLSAGGKPRTLHLDADVSALGAGDGGITIVHGTASEGAAIVRLDVAALKTSPVVTRTKLIDDAASKGGVAIWGEVEQDVGFRINSVFIGGPTSAAPRAVGKMEWPRHLQIAGDRACWASAEPHAGPTAYDDRQRPVGPIDVFVVCTSLTKGGLERAVGPLPQNGLGFVLDEQHVYWAEVTGQTTTLKRRALP